MLLNILNYGRALIFNRNHILRSRYRRREWSLDRKDSG